MVYRIKNVCQIFNIYLKQIQQVLKQHNNVEAVVSYLPYRKYFVIQANPCFNRKQFEINLKDIYVEYTHSF